MRPVGIFFINVKPANYHPQMTSLVGAIGMPERVAHHPDQGVLGEPLYFLVDYFDPEGICGPDATAYLREEGFKKAQMRGRRCSRQAFIVRPFIYFLSI